MRKNFLLLSVILSVSSACSERGTRDSQHGKTASGQGNTSSNPGDTHAERRKTDEEFLRCWGGRPAANGMTRIRFEAVNYPRNGILSSSAACPELLINIQYENNLPRELVLDPQHPDALDPHGFRGVAVVSVVARERADLMTVRVNRVIQSDIPSNAESQAIVERQGALSASRVP